MAFSSFSFPPGTPLFPRASAVKSYLWEFTKHHGMLAHIGLHSTVRSVDWDEHKKKWMVNVAGDSLTMVIREQHELDLVLVCNGHYNAPRSPGIPGLKPWLGSHLASHSMFYRNPASIPLPNLSEATILVVGGGPSGTDITSDLVGVAGKVIFSSSGNVSAAPEPRVPRERVVVILKPRTTNFNIKTKTVTFADGTEEKVDHCIVATGYEVDFPFFEGDPSSIPLAYLPKFSLPKSLSSPIDITSKALRNSTWGVAPLARHIFPFPGFFHTSRSLSLSSLLHLSSKSSGPPPTSLAFLGLPVRVAPFPLVERQARAALAAFANPSAISKKMWDAEARALLQRREALKAEFIGGGGSPEPAKVEEYISKEWLRLGEDAQFDYRDALDDFTHALYASQGETKTPQPALQKTKLWEREMYAQKGPLRAAWRALEARGEAEKWVEGVGLGEAIGEDGNKRTPEEEWVDLMQRVLIWWESEGAASGREWHVHAA